MPSSIAQLFSSGLIADLIILLMLAEGVGLVLFHRRGGRGPAPADVLPGLVAGIGLVFALRSALTGAAWPWVWLGITVALVGHVIELARRWRNSA